MYDFWFTLGAATIKPALLDAINAAGPVFDFVDRLIIEIASGVPTLRPKAPSTGLLENGPTTTARNAIAAFVRASWPAAPPIGIYTAGRFCQLVKIPAFSSGNPNGSSLKDIIGMAHTAYQTAVGGGQESALPTFPAFLGLCLMDGNFVFEFDPPTDRVKEAAAEFGITVDPSNPDWKIAAAFVKAPEFVTATQLLMAGDDSTWGGGGNTFEQIFFWDGVTEHAIP